MTLIDQIRDLISEGETEKSLEELYTYVKANNADIIDNLVMLRSRMRNLQHAVQMGTMSNQDAAFERAKINEAILKMLPQLTPEYLAQASRREAERATAAQQVKTAQHIAQPIAAQADPSASKWKYYLIGGGAVFILILMIAWCSPEENAPALTQEQQSVPEAQYTNAAPPSANTEVATTEVAATEDNLLQQVLAAHNGYAVWQPNTGQGFFEVDAEHGTCQEYGADGVAHFTFQIQAVDANYVTLYDASREMRLRIGESEALIRYDADNSWKRLYSGAWVTPTQ